MPAFFRNPVDGRTGSFCNGGYLLPADSRPYNHQCSHSAFGWQEVFNAGELKVKIVIGADHAGFELKEFIKQELEASGHTIVDAGAHQYDKDDDYPDFAAAVGRAVVAGQGERGILICGSGVGASIAANKIKGVRACLCHDIYSAAQGVEHDDMNVLCLGGLIVGTELVRKLTAGFLSAEFFGHGRYQRRLDKVLALES
jgi:ribose 5-phosphate isomerase B